MKERRARKSGKMGVTGRRKEEVLEEEEEESEEMSIIRQGRKGRGVESEAGGKSIETGYRYTREAGRTGVTEV